jgi:type II secretion system protein G
MNINVASTECPLQHTRLNIAALAMIVAMSLSIGAHGADAPAANPPKLTDAETGFVRAVQCADNLRQIGGGIYVYANAHNGSFPPDLGTLMIDQKMPMDLFVCPGSGSALPANWKSLPDPQRSAWVNAHTDYIYLGAKLKITTADSNMPVIYEKGDDHEGALNIVLGSGRNQISNVDQLKQLGIKVGPTYPTTRVKRVAGQPPVRPLITMEQARVIITRFDFDTLEGALTSFEIDAGRYPTDKEGLGILVKNSTPPVEGWKGPYLGGIPTDPWGNPYAYKTSKTEPYVVYSYGPDGKPGTADDVVSSH